MAIAIGTRIGIYEVLGPLGAGGMGEVYRARDSKLGRDVALKILPSAFTADADRVARFTREARLLASLNHPHIGAIYGFEDSAATSSGQAAVPALVLELVEGETLDERVGRGPLPLNEALLIAQQVADALDAAHGAGIVHRDLKPANIMITPEGGLKVLDFGLAKAAADGSAPEVDNAPTVTSDGTRAGVVLGTVAYMSPEQARGKPVDKRTDIWAFGCVLYQMLTGRPAFGGETLPDLIVAILEREPDLAALPAQTPSNIRRLLQSCLEKDPRRRLRDIGDVRLLMEDAVPDEPDVLATARSPRRSLAWLLAGVIGGAVLASAVFATWPLWSPPVTPPEPSLQRVTDFVGLEESPAFSPDGKTVAFVARTGGKRQIWIRLLAGGGPRQVTRDDVDHEQPRWTPDSSFLLYFVPSPTPGEHGTIWKIPMLGDQPQRVISALAGGDLSHDGRRLAVFQFVDNRIVLVLSSLDGSAPDLIRPLPPTSTFEYPRWSPDDRWIAFQQDHLGTGFDKRLLVVSADGDSEPQEIARATELGGLAWLPGSSGLVYSSSKGSTMLYPPVLNLRAVGRDGTGDRQLTFGDVSYQGPDAHPSSGTIAVSRVRVASDIWQFPVNGSPEENTNARVQITRQTGQAQTPSVSPDAAEVVYVSDAGGHSNLWITRTDGSGITTQVTREQNPAISVGAPKWSPTGNEILFVVTQQPGGTSLSLISRDGSGRRSLVPSGLSASWSVDGQWVYYQRNNEGTVCIEKAPIGGGAAVPVRCDNAGSPVPASDSTLYFANRLTQVNGTVDYDIRRARPETAPTSEQVVQLSGSRLPVNRRLLAPAVSPDGQWIAMPLADGITSNIWLLSARDKSMRPITDFSQHPVLIVRSVSWSPDGKHLYAAVAESDADIVLLVGLR